MALTVDLTDHGGSLANALLRMTIVLVLVAVAWTASWWVASSITFPLSRLVRDVQSAAGFVERGGLHVNWTASDDDVEEIGAMRDAIERLASVVRAQASRRAFTTAMLAHDMRTPLIGAVREILHLADSEAESSRRLVPDLHRVASELVEVLALVDQTVDLERFGSSTLQFKSAPVRLADDVVKPVLERVRSLVRERTISLDVLDTSEVATDPRAMQRAVHNLVINALRAANSTVRVTVFAGGVRVADDGPGLPRPLGELLAPFATGSEPEPRAPGHGGPHSVGLGLYIADAIARLGGGRLVLERTGPKGTVFLLYIGISR